MKIQNTNEDFKDNKDFIFVTYYGPTYALNVATPTGILLRQYGREYYGLYYRGQQFYVHKDDVKARPDLFRGVVESEETPAPVAEPSEKAEESTPETDEPKKPAQRNAKKG